MGLAFYRAVGDTPIGYVIDTGGGSRASYQSLTIQTIAQAFKTRTERYYHLRDKYGEKRIESVAEQVMALPLYRTFENVKKLPNGRVGTSKQLIELLLGERE